jgi:hypothetical protein
MNFDVFFIYKNISKKLPFKLPVGFIIEILIRILCLSGFLYMNSLRLFIPRPSWKQAFPGYAAQFTSKSAAKLVLKDCGKIEVCAMKLVTKILHTISKIFVQKILSKSLSKSYQLPEALFWC